MDDQGRRNLINNSVFFLVITVGFFIISLICITDCCLIKSNCNRNNPKDTTALYQKSVEIDSSSKTIQLSSNNSNRTTAKTDTVITTQEKTTTSIGSNNPASLDSIVFNLTLAVNAINNVLSGGAIALGILTLFIGLVGLFGFNTLRDSIREYTEKHNKETQDSIDEIKTRINNAFNEFAINQNTRLDNHNNSIASFIDDINTRFNNFEDDTDARLKDFENDTKVRLDSFESDANTRLGGFEHDSNARLERFEHDTHNRINTFTGTIDDYTNRVERFATQINNLRESLTQQSTYFDYIIDYFYQVIYSNIELMDDQSQSELLLNHLYHVLQIARLYRTYITEDEAPVVNTNRIAALEYLEGEGNGTMDDIPHLDYVVEHDPDERIRQRAIEVRAIIRNRNNN